MLWKWHSCRDGAFGDIVEHFGVYGDVWMAATDAAAKSYRPVCGQQGARSLLDD